jgi:hypothetical protein
VRGAAHARSGLPNQDAIAWLPEGSSAPQDQSAALDTGGAPAEAGGPALVLAVSDGHGSAKCFRSATGARLAVDTALAVIGQLAEQLPDAADPAALPAAAEQVVWRWRAAVDADLLACPLSEEELGRLATKEGSVARHAVERNPRLAYGATLLAVLATGRYVAYFQLGDGDVLAVSERGDVSRPLAGDPRLFAGETTSLCSRDAVSHFRTGLHLLGEDAPPAPALIVVSTDGYANSFRTDADFAKVGADLLEMVRGEGLDAVGGCLESWLHEASAFGSGDDVTVGIVCRIERRDETYVDRRVDPGIESADLDYGA